MSKSRNRQKRPRTSEIPTPLWGNSGKAPRPIYTEAEIDQGALNGLCVLNSTIGGVIKDERYFTAVRNPNGQFVTCLHLPPKTQEYTLRLYVHNNNRSGFDACASDVGVRFRLPTSSSTQQTITGFISARNTLYADYWSEVRLASHRPFHLEYVTGSALIENNGIGKDGGRQLPDEIVGPTPVTIGVSSLNGKIPGGYAHASYISIRIRAVFD